MERNELLRRIPAMELLLGQARQDPRFDGLSHGMLLELLREAAAAARQQLATGRSAADETTPAALTEKILARTAAARARLLEPSLRKVVNATGVVLHTNLGRAPLGARALAAVRTVAEGYSTLEYDLAAGGRGERYTHVAQRLEKLTGAEAALVVNNNAAAVMLAVAGIARDREVIVSRGELVEIGGSFRIPDVIRQSGAALVEVGTTNKTRLADYAAAITPNTAAILKVHTSNFAIIGFTSQPEFAELCDLCRERGIVSINDVGSGTLLPLELSGHREPTVQECLNAGFDLVTFSGDKLLGSGQAGIIAGRRQYIDQLKKEPLLRALRIDKLSLAALEGTLTDYMTGLAGERIPGWAMLHAAPADLQAQAQSLANRLTAVLPTDWQVRVAPTRSLAGGGSLPAVELAGYGVELIPGALPAGRLERRLRENRVPVIALIREETLLLDVRCLLPGDEEIVCDALARISRGGGR
ncbi:MAG: L-seryl-tRNA(Sec) selenium transferase [Veillonellaceae bacterium]|nr:L-seryl-tRNA(Sec) selenium transferase [Veillonellaceae bacterium]